MRSSFAPDQARAAMSAEDAAPADGPSTTDRLSVSDDQRMEFVEKIGVAFH